jgi:hypothetical protein
MVQKVVRCVKCNASCPASYVDQVFTLGVCPECDAERRVAQEHEAYLPEKGLD